ncbi:MAG: molybdenum cofactor biosynthesis protein MoaE, partial [Planctomycetales bacterium]|nr:molybdenum cofactor biosynthesis protein MoaE [Planctomycetales bacterium]
VTRATTDGRETTSLDYQCYPEMARAKLHELQDQALTRWPLTACSIVHRLGHLEPEEASVAVAVSSPHRGDAFAAGQWLIDTLKEVVPIWKQENWADGSSEWVHPGLSANESP